MTFDEYFGDWAKVIDKTETTKIMKWLNTVDKDTLCPSTKNIFKAFKVTPFKDLKVIVVSQDPYPQKGVAQGILFANTADTKVLSPSLEIVKESVIDYSIPHNHINFDITLESWCKQGVLMINSAFTCEVNNVGSHYNIWEGFTSKLLNNISTYDDGYVFILFGKQAQSFRHNIVGNHLILEEYHPAYYARNGTIMPNCVFSETNKYLKNKYGQTIEWYKEDNILEG